jgi:periplasmic copper chaperone A
VILEVSQDGYTFAVRKNVFGCNAARLALFFILQASWAGDFRSGALILSGVWAHPTPPGTTVGAVYFSITNTGRNADRLMAISSPIARTVEIHETRTVQGMMQMLAVASVECPPGVVRVEPGALHVMLIGLNRPLTAGLEFPLSLEFRDAGVLTVQVRVGGAE